MALSVRSATLLMLAAIPLTAESFTVDDERKSFDIHRTSEPPVLDGRLDDAVWKAATRIDDFHQTSPVDGATPTEATVVWVAYDDEYLYVAANLLDSHPRDISAKQMIQGRQFFSDDRFWITIDSFNTRRNDYFFQVNANGVRRDALRENNARFIDEWSAIWLAESAIHEHGWATEMAIPFRSISFSPGNDTWGINFGRSIARKQEFNLWSSHERQDWPAYGGELVGIDGIEQGLGLDVVPSVVVGRDRDLATGAETSRFEPSLDLRYRLTPSLSATLTLNTDFSTAEVDEQQVALDRFSLFYPEKRSFFLQDAGIFEFGNIDENGRPFFSRRIGLAADGMPVGVDGGLKLTGRVGDFSVGALAIRQEAWGDVDASDLVVARGSLNVLAESALGFVATHGDPASNDDNAVLGVDFLYRDSDGPFGQILTTNLWAQQSDTPGLRGNDSAFGVAFEIPSDVLSIDLKGTVIGEDFRPALGFVNRAGIRQAEAELRYRTRPERGRWRAINHRALYRRTTDLDGRMLSEYTRVRPVSFYSHTDDFLFVEWERNTETVLQDFELFGRLAVPAGEYRFDRVRAEIATGVQRPLQAVLSVQRGGFFGGDRLEKFVELNWRQSAHLSLGLIFEENVVDLPAGSFTSHLASLRADVAFNARWSWTTLLQYDNTAEAAGLDTRLRYLPRAGREVIFVFNQGAGIDAGNRFASTASDLNLKIGYTFRY